MNTKNFYIFRHGQTDVNKEKRFQGQLIDASLNEDGRKEAENSKALLADKEIEVIYSSPLKRALETAEIISGGEIPIIEDKAFIEGKFGMAEGRNKANLKNTAPELYADWRNLDDEHMDTRFPGGESKREIRDRFVEGVNKLLETDYKTIGISSHSAAIRCFLLSFDQQVQNIPNAAIVHISCENGKLTYKGFLANALGQATADKQRS